MDLARSSLSKLTRNILQAMLLIRGEGGGGSELASGMHDKRLYGVILSTRFFKLRVFTGHMLLFCSQELVSGV